MERTTKNCIIKNKINKKTNLTILVSQYNEECNFFTMSFSIVCVYSFLWVEILIQEFHLATLYIRNCISFIR